MHLCVCSEKQKGEIAYTIVESDGRLPEDVAKKLEDNENVQNVMIIQP